MANRNEKKAREFAEDRGHDSQSVTEAFVACLDMADWKDEKFKELVREYIRLGYDSGQPVNLLEDLLNEI